eukprot:TRINITY_DN852_c0_g1_i1.p4 TRINITY_DN852_c0_g1~~TRINITY_DN852_c0_g1_i1.p4  ORF type:complete len:109 (-),score=23.61 TRINITY_DN852_c0_g1_i1:347-673(-)
MSLLQYAGSSVALSLRSVACSTVRMFSMEGLPKYDEKERGEEALYFSKEDERAMRKLLSKVKQQADTDVAERQKQDASEQESLKAIVSKYNISQDDFMALLKWKHDQH